ncbi:MAG: hypothetical protein KR126chlam4_00113 [Candidatus Anoxychlamydiales bacterium]|uniref:Uncharacterized protein n=1 Tax=marine sediment metagenome TaxID=412755 RepID=A0A0F9E6P1_9ZZZZ|nr:hypothetical protein [Candidatus Anoxychlamydiales bacterium]NGX40296.1 hypothetical protein [Candidatus Anoxychlamydiales bacterium]HEU63965.1 hypothetical protein [Chlamydiota bacterium]
MAAAAPAPVLGPRVDAEDVRISQMIQDDLKGYWLDPLHKVLNDPIRAIVYSVAIKALSWFVALIFPFIAYNMFGLSIGLIDRIAYNHFTLFFQGVINGCKDFARARAISVRDRIISAIDELVDSIPRFAV